MLYIVEIPHQMPPRCWVANDLADMAARTFAESGGDWQTFTPDQAVRAFGSEREDWPDGLSALIDAGKTAVMYQLRDTDEIQYAAVEDAPTLAAWVEEVIGHDLHACYILTTEEALERLRSGGFGGHGGLNATAALVRQLRFEGELPHDLDPDAEEEEEESDGWGPLTPLGDGQNCHQYPASLDGHPVAPEFSIGVMGHADEWILVNGEDGVQYGTDCYETAAEAREAAEAAMRELS